MNKWQVAANKTHTKEALDFYHQKKKNFRHIKIEDLLSKKKNI